MITIYKQTVLIALLLCNYITGERVYAEEYTKSETHTIQAEVTAVLAEKQSETGIGDIKKTEQTLEVKLLGGTNKGTTTTIENDYLPVSIGTGLFLYEHKEGDATYYELRDINRMPILIGFVLLFILVVLVFSGRQGLRSLLGLIGSFFVILYILIPSLLLGYPPIITSTFVATAILCIAIFFTHGFSRISVVAFIGTVLAVICTGVLAYIGVVLSHFTGLSAEESFYLDIQTKGALDFTGLLLGGIMIGVLGVLDDIAITQSAVVRELYESAPNLSKREVYTKAIRVGREHVGALVNTLALAYTGASLPLLLLFSSSKSSFYEIANQEIFATEIIRTISGSIGLVLTVPITTILAVYALRGYTKKTAGHTHHHVHTHA